MISRVCVCVLTYKRDAQLRVNLQSLLAQVIPEDAAFRVDLLVIDNDATGSARELVQETCAAATFPWRYTIAPQRGIPQARNHALEQTEEYDFLAFIDDDEFAAPDWIAQLMSTQRRFDASVVCGPVYPNYAVDVPAWIIEGRFFAPRKFKTGQDPFFVETNNVLIDRKAIGQLRFDERFWETGGSDTFFFLNVKQRGVRATWCAEAIVYEDVGLHRASARWLLERAYSAANRYTRACNLVMPGMKTITVRLAKGLAGITVGLLRAAVFCWSKPRAVHALMLASRGVGSLTGVFGVSYRYYIPRKLNS